LKKDIISLVKLPDLLISKVYLKLFQEKNYLSIFLFHGLFRNKEESLLNLVDPQPWITVEQFHQFVTYYLDNGYKFVSPDDIVHGLKEENRYAMITFDDGYFNNRYALPILQKYDIPAVFFISTNHVLHKKCFWWDVIYRERKKEGKSTNEILNEQYLLKTKTHEEIEKHILDSFGETAFRSRGDIDRPFSPSELNEFLKDKHVFLGNHTCDHAILTKYASNEIKSQILDAQNAIHDITGITPIAISYPDGKYSDEIIKISKELGMKLGITVDYRKNKLPIDCQVKGCMRLGRFDLSGSNNIINQCELFRSDILVYAWVWNFLTKRYTS